MPLLRAFHSESPYSAYEFNETGVKEAFQKAVQAEKTQSVVLLSRNNQNEPTGLLAALKSNVPFLKGTIALEWAWFVLPSDRRSKIGLELLEAFEYWAENVAKVEYIQVSLLTDPSLQPQLLSRLYSRRGYNKTEEAYIKVL